MASGPTTSWQIDEETVADFIFLDSTITADGDLNHEIKRHLLLVSYDKPRQSIKRQTHHFAKICRVKDMVFPVVMYGYQSWTIKKAEHQRIDAFELSC